MLRPEQTHVSGTQSDWGLSWAPGIRGLESGLRLSISGTQWGEKQAEAPAVGLDRGHRASRGCGAALGWVPRRPAWACDARNSEEWTGRSVAPLLPPLAGCQPRHPHGPASPASCPAVLSAAWPLAPGFREAPSTTAGQTPLRPLSQASPRPLLLHGASPGPEDGGEAVLFPPAHHPKLCWAAAWSRRSERGRSDIKLHTCGAEGRAVSRKVPSPHCWLRERP